MTDDVVQYDKNIVYRVTYLCPLKVTQGFYDDVEENFPVYNKTTTGEVHIFHEVVIVIAIDEHVIDTLDQPTDMIIIPAGCILDIHPLYYRKEKNK